MKQAFEVKGNVKGPHKTISCKFHHILYKTLNNLYECKNKLIFDMHLTNKWLGGSCSHPNYLGYL
jgi:hypothetical protein